MIPSLNSALLTVGVLTALTLFSGLADAGETVKPLQVGKTKVWAIADSTGDRNMEVFADADPAILAEYAPSGKVPSAIMTYAVQTAGMTVLIDTGLGAPSGERASRLMAGLAAAGLAPEKIDAVLITHMHGDHIGGLLRDGGKAFPNAVVKIGQVELDFWLSEESRAKYPDREANFDLARKVVEEYGDKVQRFAFNDEVAPGITAVDAIGHTPGHTAFFLESESEKLLCVGDLLHAAALQFPHPEINASYDMIPNLAAAARTSLLEFAAAQSIPVAGMHIPFPGIGLVGKIGENSYSFEPLR